MPFLKQLTVVFLCIFPFWEGKASFDNLLENPSGPSPRNTTSQFLKPPYACILLGADPQKDQGNLPYCAGFAGAQFMELLTYGKRLVWEADQIFFKDQNHSKNLTEELKTTSFLNECLLKSPRNEHYKDTYQSHFAGSLVTEEEIENMREIVASWEDKDSLEILALLAEPFPDETCQRFCPYDASLLSLHPSLRYKNIFHLSSNLQETSLYEVSVENSLNSEEISMSHINFHLLKSNLGLNTVRQKLHSDLYGHPGEKAQNLATLEWEFLKLESIEEKINEGYPVLVGSFWPIYFQYPFNRSPVCPPIAQMSAKQKANGGYHAFVIMGFALTSQNKKRYLVKNSWGPHWGIKGLGAAWVCSKFFSDDAEYMTAKQWRP